MSGVKIVQVVEQQIYDLPDLRHDLQQELDDQYSLTSDIVTVSSNSNDNSFESDDSNSDLSSSLSRSSSPQLNQQALTSRPKTHRGCSDIFDGSGYSIRVRAVKLVYK